jgi:hypothetical protein
MCHNYPEEIWTKVEGTLEIKKEMIPLLKKEIQRSNQLEKENSHLEYPIEGDQPENLISRINLNENGEIEIGNNDSYGAGVRRFVLWFKNFVKEGKLEFVTMAEREYVKGYWFDGKGNVHELVYPEPYPKKEKFS